MVIGAHYDSVFGCPGANDNGSGVAALLALARRFAGKPTGQTLRFVAFVNEEPPYFQTEQMGSFVYASRCKARGDQDLGHDQPGNDRIFFRRAGLAELSGARTRPAFYPTTGNFIGFVGNVGSRASGAPRHRDSFANRRNFRPKARRCRHSSPASAGRINGRSGSTVIPAIMITDTAPFRYPHYHEATDTPDKLDYDRFALVVSGMEKMIAELAYGARKDHLQSRIDAGRSQSSAS